MPYRLASLKNWRTKLSAIGLTIACMSGAMGCGAGKLDGPTRFDLSGTATYETQPIPFGTIMIAPDTKQNNNGPMGVADIRDGHYQMRKGMGHIGGPQVLTIYATDGTRPLSDSVDNTLFPPYEMRVTLPAKSSVLDIVVPRSGTPKQN